MYKRKKFLAAVLAGCMVFSTVPVQSVQAAEIVKAAKTSISGLTTEYMTNPLGIEADKVRFGWKMDSTIIGASQSAYQIKVSDENGKLVWDSGKMADSRSTGIVCKGELTEGMQYTWEVTVWNEVGEICKNSSTFETGVTHMPEWRDAEFIRMNKSKSAPIFRTEQELEGSVIKKARLYITALGAYQAYVNGYQTGEWDENGKLIYHHMNPGYGNANVSLGYQTYDITPFLKGEDSIAVAVEAGTGWYNGMGNTDASQPAVKALVVIEYVDGTRQIIKTNTTDWKGTISGEITANGIYYGEDYNACFAEELGDYTQIGYDDSAWVNGHGDSAATKAPCIENVFEEQSASHVRIQVEETGPAISGVNEHFLQLMEIELLGENKKSIISGLVPQVSNTWSPNNQWSPNHLTDGDLGMSSDYGYTSTLLGTQGATSYTLAEPISITFNLGKEVSFDTLKMYPRTALDSVLSGICPNYPQRYSIYVSEDGNTWTKIGSYTQSAVKNTTMTGDAEMSVTTFPGEIRAQVGIPGRITGKYDKYPVEAHTYSRTKASSNYAGGEVLIDDTYSGADMFDEGVILKKGQTMVVNMGQNLTAVPNIRFAGEMGTKATLRFAEMLNDGSSVGSGATQADGPKGSIYQKSLRNARSQATYVFAGNDIETYQPKMSFFGYQYVEITANDDITIYGLVSKGISSVSEQTGNIVTNNENVNKLFQNVLYGQLSNYYTTPTDCNQRDERQSWSGDTQAFAQTAVYNFDSYAFLNDMQDIYAEVTKRTGYVPSVVDQSGQYFGNWAAGWSDVLVILPWTLYLQTGDINILEENWDVMDSYMKYLQARERSANLCWIPNNERNFGDWLSFQGTSIEVIYDYYYGYMHQLMVQIAGILDKEVEQFAYEDKFEAIKDTFIATHVTFNNGNLVIKSGEGNINNQFMHWAGKGGVWENNSQTSLLWMLKLGFYDSEEMKEAAEELLLENIKNEDPNPSSIRAQYGENTLAVGFLGSNVITPVLSESGNSEMSYDLLLQDGQPSWLFEVKAGATTIWERWNSYTPGVGFGDSEMNSFNHYAYGSVVEWMYRYMAGIAADVSNPGFKNIILQPTLDTGNQYNEEERIHSVNASYESCYGTITSAWESEDGKLISYKTKIPANTTATLYLPVDTKIAEGFKTIDGVVAKGTTIHNEQTVLKLQLEAGAYDFIVKNGILSVTYGITKTEPDTNSNQKPNTGIKPEDKDVAQAGTIALVDAEKLIITTNTDKKDVAGSTFEALQLKGKEGNKSVKLSWNKVKDADGYILYGAPCGKAMEMLQEVSSGKKSYKVKSLKKGKYYKYILAAYKIIQDEKRIVAISSSVHVSTKGGKSGNPTAISYGKKKVTVKTGKTYALKPKLKSKGKVKTHIAKFRYESSNPAIATVSKKGKIKGMKKGNCYMYMYTQNGVYKRVKVTVR